MRKKSILITSSLLLLTSAATAAEYTVSGTRYLRKYTAPQKSQVYMAEVDAQRIANKMCDVKWEKSDTTYATATTHVTTNLDWNVGARESFDAALFCANHAGDEHVAYANAACYVFEFPGGSLPTLTNLEMTVYSDPYNAYGARISVMASDRLDIPTDCATVRGDAAGGIRLAGVCPRVTRTSGNSSTWYPASSNVVFNASNALSTPLQLKRYLFVFVLMENYATSRGNWLEGCSWIENEIKIKTSASIPAFETSESCDIAEPYATQYHLKDGHADEDWDGDGLSNYAEYLITEVYKFAQLDPDNPKTNGSCVDFFRTCGNLYLGEVFSNFKSPYADPVSIDKLDMTVSYYGKRRVHAPVIVKCWMVSRDPEMTGCPDMTWTTAAFTLNGTHVQIAYDIENEGLENAICGKCRYVAFADMDANGDFTPGEPFAYWEDGAVPSHDVTLTDRSQMFARVNLTNGSTDYTGEQYANVTVEDIGTDFTVLNVQAVESVSGKVRVRVVRSKVNGQLSYEHTYDEEYSKVCDDAYAVVLDKYFDLSARSYLHEGDFIADGKYDADWGYGRLDVWKNKRFYDATNVTYLIVMGEGIVNSASTNIVLRCAVTKNYNPNSTRRYGFVKPVIDMTNPGFVYGEHPTLRWTMADTSGNWKPYDNYTAFKVMILNENASRYTSDFMAAPARGTDGYYNWKLDKPLGAIVGTSGEYSWSVAMYNEKFTNEYNSSWCTTWSSAGPLVINMNNQQPMNDHGYSSIAATVKYAGFYQFGDTGHWTNHITNARRCIVQAFDNAGFEGEPCGACFATQDVLDKEKIAANAWIKGLPQDGTYWLRAFIDEDSDGEKDDWEPWGEANEPVSITSRTLTRPTVGIWIEDVDTDGDWLPDAWEYLQYGNLTSHSGNIIDGDNILFSGTFNSSGTAGISTGLSGASLTIFQNQSFVNSMVGITDVVSITNVLAAVEKAKSPSAFKINALTIAPDGRSVTLSVTPDVALSIAGETLGQYVNITSGDMATVQIKVYKKETLATASWTLVWTTADIQVSRYATEITTGISVVKGIDMTSGFYKIEVVQ